MKIRKAEGKKKIKEARRLHTHPFVKSVDFSGKLKWVFSYHV